MLDYSCDLDTVSDEDSCCCICTCFVDLKRDKTGRVQIYTDGWCQDNGKCNASAGIGVWFNHGHLWNQSDVVDGRQTKHAAEFQAVTRALEIAKQEELAKIRIFTDSTLVHNSVKGETSMISKWKANGWKLASGNPPVNLDEIKKLDEAEGEYKKMGGDVAYQLVKASTTKGYVEADMLARAGAQRERQQHSH